MSWINSGAFKIANRNGRHYVFRRNNAGNTEINIPKNITTKYHAKAWLKAHPNKVAKPNRYRAKRVLNPVLFARPPRSPSPWRPAIPNRKMSPMSLSPPKPYLPMTPTMTNKELQNFYYTVNRNNWNVSCDKLHSSLKKLKKVGSGRQGVVFLASKFKDGRHPFAIKIAPRDLSAAARKEPQPVDVEFKIQSAVQKCSKNVVKVFKSMRCMDFVKHEQIDAQNLQNSRKFDKSKQGIIIMEFCEGGDLANWIGKTQQQNDTMMFHLISDILGALHDIQTKYPEFRHNDLYMSNIFVSHRGFLIGDFGWSRLEKTGTNPAVNTANGTVAATDYGVGPKTDPRYDHHMFLNELLTFAMKNPAKFPKSLAFLKRAIPDGYRGAKDVHVNKWRLKYGDSCPGLPSLTEIMAYPFLKGGKRVASPNLVVAKARLRKTGRKLTPARNLSPKKVPAPQKRNLSAANYLKLSPASRAKLKEARAASALKKPNKLKLNLTERKKTAALVGIVIAKKHKPLPPGLLKSNKFNKLINKIYKSQGSKEAESFNNAWSRARNKAIQQVQNRVNANKPPFTPSPPKAKAPSPPKAKAPSPPKARNLNYKLSPTSGRVKIKAPNSGRYVYANGQSVSLEYLKSLANRLKVDIKGLRSKANIAKRIFSAKNK